MSKTRLDTKVCDAILTKLDHNNSKIIRAIAFTVEGRYKTTARIDLGALRNSTYTVTENEDGFSAAAQSAQSANPGVTLNEHPKPDKNKAHVGPSVDYAIYNEIGTSKMIGDNALYSAGQYAQQIFESPDKWKELVQP